MYSVYICTSTYVYMYVVHAELASTYDICMYVFSIIIVPVSNFFYDFLIF